MGTCRRARWPNHFTQIWFHVEYILPRYHSAWGAGQAQNHTTESQRLFPNQPLAGTPAAAGHVQGPGMAKGFDFYSTKNEVLVLSLSLRLMPSFSAGLENYLKELMFFWGLGNFDETSWGLPRSCQRSMDMVKSTMCVFVSPLAPKLAKLLKPIRGYGIFKHTIFLQAVLGCLLSSMCTWHLVTGRDRNGRWWRSQLQAKAPPILSFFPKTDWMSSENDSKTMQFSKHMRLFFGWFFGLDQSPHCGFLSPFHLQVQPPAGKGQNLRACPSEARQGLHWASGSPRACCEIREGIKILGN